MKTRVLQVRAARDHSVIARGLAFAAGSPVTYDGDGRPHAEQHVSIAHGGEVVIVALSDREVGVDVEPIDRTRKRDLDALTWGAFGTRAVRALRKSRDRARTFARWWVRAEAIAKITGGLVIPAPRRVRGIAVRDLPTLPGHVAAIAWRRK